MHKHFDKSRNSGNNRKFPLSARGWNSLDNAAGTDAGNLASDIGGPGRSSTECHNNAIVSESEHQANKKKKKKKLYEAHQPQHAAINMPPVVSACCSWPQPAPPTNQNSRYVSPIPFPTLNLSRVRPGPNSSSLGEDRRRNN